jgi:hypothetical protein
MLVMRRVVRLSFLINTQRTAEGRSPGQPRLGRPRQHLFLARSDAEDRRRHSDAASAVFRQDRTRPVRNV